MNKSILSKVFMFAVGAAVGSAVTYKLVKTKFEQIANKEIEEIREYYREKIKEDEQEEDKEEPIKKETKPNADSERVDAVTYLKDKIDALGYNAPFGGDEMDAKERLQPHVIPPEDFGDQGYDTISLTLYADGVLVDDQENIIEDADAMLGEGSLERFGEFEDDSLHVRDDKLKVDYEILGDDRTSFDVGVQ